MINIEYTTRGHIKILAVAEKTWHSETKDCWLVRDITYVHAAC
jgi:hypothetical protein